MLKFYYNNGPNPAKVALFLEEAELTYEPIPVDTRKGEQFTPEYLAINPNAKAPTLVDGDATIFDSNAILLYLAEKTGKFLPGDDPANRGQLLSWLMFIASGIGPYSGQSVHFQRYAPQNMPYAVNRYRFEANRHYAILNDKLADSPYILGDDYTIVDMAAWGWARLLPMVLDDDAWSTLPHLKRLIDEINARPAVQGVEALREKHAFKTEMDADSNRYMFPSNEKSS
ncbi:MAG: glutathione S-transferase N-terminal domain-containing protein [Alphaproteobacteria bacterium]|nr:glutathione S-transferase N-terminal domain-containing protein [Alphaproteobacteria bacterium]